ncbi:RNA-directed DNA polymerase (Reverse transcriptase), partial [Trifolium medium]|nr:RNA-directed DNA polymerase (Reverse transcriptase) [Trifolium medium]
MLNIIRGRLGSWGNKYVSLGGRIVLINAVLSAIPIFYLSFMKMPVKVWKEVVKIQRKFLWGGLSKKNRTCWVKWDDICKSKQEGGLGIRDLRLVNISLLTKWRWKLLSQDNEVWKEVVAAKYGGNIIGKVNPGQERAVGMSSKWWLDICNLDKNSDWFTRAVVKRVGNGSYTKFWTDIWVEDQALCVRFPRLYSISIQKESSINNMGRWDGNQWVWELQWRKIFFDWEEQLKEQLLQ